MNSLKLTVSLNLQIPQGYILVGTIGSICLVMTNDDRIHADTPLYHTTSETLLKTLLAFISHRFMSGPVRQAGLSDQPGSNVSETPVMVCLTFERDTCKDYSCRHRRPGPHYTLTIRSQINRWPWGRGTGTPTACHAGPPPTGWSPHPSSDVRGTVAETPSGNFTDGILYLNAAHMVL